ncbi:hypothetical protein F8M41_024051 [Gigaspora margarita]|uniref:Uncharacterized protein n=1 Tax=Gigaspora margarita TaxID=4874 RepID=A0A8H4ACF1_GIGMA|nr:hypothetical protein F8M41_024051 [Gigaspora margarita]
MNKENKVVDRNYEYFLSDQFSDQQWTHLGYLNYCDRNNILRTRRTESQKYKEYLEDIIKNYPNKKTKAIKAKQALNRSSKKRKEQVDEFWKRQEQVHQASGQSSSRQNGTPSDQSDPPSQQPFSSYKTFK